MAEAIKAKKAAKAPKLADPVGASIDPATQELIKRAQDLNIYTVFDLSLIHISEPTRHDARSRMPSYA